MRVGVAAAQVPFVHDAGLLRGRELVRALRRAGHEAEMIPIPFNGLPHSRLAEQMLVCQLLDLEESMGTRIDRIIGLTFPAYLVPHTRKTIWLLRRCELTDVSADGMIEGEGVSEPRRLARQADARLIPQARRVFAPSPSAADWLRADCGVAAQPLLAPPAAAERYRYGGDGDFFLLPDARAGRPRRELVLAALRHTRYPARVRIVTASGDAEAGAPEQDTARSSAGFAVADRVSQEHATEDERRALLGSCLAVILPMQREADGLAALEAMLSDKAIVTCDDAGGPADLVHHGHTGFICPPTPEALAETLDRLWEDRALARRLGQAAGAAYRELRLSWKTVAEALLI